MSNYKIEKYVKMVLLIVLILSLIGVFFVALKLVRVRKERPVTPIEETELSSEPTSLGINEGITEVVENTTEPYVENFHYYDNDEYREELNLVGEGDYKKATKVYSDGENKVIQQEKFLGDLYNTLSPVLEEIENIADSELEKLEYIDDLNRDYVIVEDLESSMLHGTKTYSEVVKNLSSDYVIKGCSVIDYFNDTTVVCMPGYRDSLEDNILFVVDTSDRKYDTYFEWETIRIGDMWLSFNLLNNNYSVIEIGEFNVVFAKN